MLNLLFTLAALNAAPEPGDILGRWQTENPDGIVVVADCGDGTPCGTLRITGPDADALDANNPDEALRDRPLDGAAMLWGFERARDGSWRRGRIYDPEGGRVYRARLERTGEATLKVDGCLGPICRSQTWRLIEDGAD